MGVRWIRTKGKRVKRLFRGRGMKPYQLEDGKGTSSGVREREGRRRMRISDSGFGMGKGLVR